MRTNNKKMSFQRDCTLQVNKDASANANKEKTVGGFIRGGLEAFKCI